MPLASSAVYCAGSSSARSSSSVGEVSPSSPCGAPAAKKFRCSSVSPVKPIGWPWLTWNGTPLACASLSGAVSVTPVPVAPAVPTDAIWPVSRFWPVSMKNGWPADEVRHRRRP